jgi:hypothetical protein
MKIETRNRAELRSYFLKNKIPTEAHFADLINAGINQKDDGIVKAAGNPLSIQAEGTSTSERRALNLYLSFDAPNPDWTVSLNPRSNPADANTAREGLGFNDKTGTNRLFIDSATGRVGIGTNNPQTALEISGSLKASMASFGGNIGIGLDNPQQRLVVFGAKHGPKDPDSQLNVAGQVAIKSTEPQLDFVDTDADHKDWSIHVNSGRMYFISSPWTDNNLVLNNNGKVGIGIVDPKQQLVINSAFNSGKEADNALSNGGALAIRSDAPQIDFIDTERNHLDWAIHVNAGRMYFIRQPWEHTDLVLDGPTGRVGVGLITPEQKLSVNGYVASMPIYFSAYVDSNDYSGDRNPLPLKTASNNYGSGFSTSSSTFTAPITGVYLFTMTGYRVETSAADGILHWYLQLNGGNFNAGGTAAELDERGLLTWPKGYVGTSSRTVITRLNRGDKVTIKQVGTGRVDNYRSGLEGVLITAIDTQVGG